MFYSNKYTAVYLGTCLYLVVLITHPWKTTANTLHVTETSFPRDVDLMVKEITRHCSDW
jgi:hypothetical protein